MLGDQREAALDWHEIYERLARRPERPDPLAREALERRVQAWTRDDEVAAEVCAEVWHTFNLARGGAAFEGFVQGRFVEVVQTGSRGQPPTPQPLRGAERGESTLTPALSQGERAQASAEEERVERLRVRLEELRARNPRHYRALSLRYADRATVQEMADDLAVDVWAVRSLMMRARLSLAQGLERGERKTGRQHKGRPPAGRRPRQTRR